MKNIKYVFLGNSQNLKEIGEYPNNATDISAKESKTIFTTYCRSSKNTKYEERNKVVGTDGNYYFTIMPTNTFYLVLADGEFPQARVFNLIEEIHKESIYLLVDEKAELNKIGKQSLKQICDSYQRDEKLAEVNKDIESIRIEMKQNVKNIVGNLEDVEVLKNQSEKIKDSSNTFAKKSAELKRLTCWSNFKWTIILSVLVIGVLLIIILPIALSGKKKDSENSGAGSVSSDKPPLNSTLLM
jgi:hypothetical protein